MCDSILTWIDFATSGSSVDNSIYKKLCDRHTSRKKKYLELDFARSKIVDLIHLFKNVSCM